MATPTDVLSEPPEQQRAPRWEDLSKRTASALVLIAICAVCEWLGGIVFAALIILAALILHQEWMALTLHRSLKWRLLGYPYIIIPSVALLWLREYDVMAPIALIGIVTATDTGAYFTGKLYGKHKLAPQISPKKTWEGLAGGVLCAVVAGILLLPLLLPSCNMAFILALSICLAVIAQIGDLFKSHVKRSAGVKDSGKLLPGHGGLLDRFDGYMFTAPLLALLLYIVKAL